MSTSIPTPTPIYLTETRELTAAAGDEADSFGASVALARDGTTALIGAPGIDYYERLEAAGAAYVFTRREGIWRQQATLAPADGDRGDRFGFAVGLVDDGNTALISALQDEDPNGSDAGSAYVFERANGDWVQQAKLTAADGDEFDEFGRAASLVDDGSMALLGTPYDNHIEADAGSAYVFAKYGGDWTQQMKLVPDDADANDEFGRAADLADDGNTALISAPQDEHPNGEGAGAAYVFDGSAGWSEVTKEQTKLVASDGGSDDDFGRAVALSGDGSTALVGAQNHQDANDNDIGRGAVYAYDLSASDPQSTETKLQASDTDDDAQFGFSVALSDDGTTALVGAPVDQGGRAFVFVRAGGTWTQRVILAAADGDKGDRFGVAVGLTGDGTTAIVGARFDDSNKEDAGAAYLFDL